MNFVMPKRRHFLEPLKVESVAAGKAVVRSKNFAAEYVKFFNVVIKKLKFDCMVLKGSECEVYS